MDTSSFLEGWGNQFFPPRLPQVEVRIGGLIAEGRLKIPEIVRVELENSTDAHDWVKTQVGLIVPFDSVQEAMVRRILQDFSNLVDVVTNSSYGDPFVIALAKCRGYELICEERPGSSDHPKIPYVCHRIGVKCIKLNELMQREGWI